MTSTLSYPVREKLRVLQVRRPLEFKSPPRQPRHVGRYLIAAVVCSVLIVMAVVR